MSTKQLGGWRVPVLTEEEKRLARKLYMNYGVSITDIARRLGRERSTVWKAFNYDDSLKKGASQD